MGKLSIKLNLSQLKSVVRTEKGATGPVECIIIPIENNHLFKGKSGVYLDMTAFEFTNTKTDSKDTHLLKQSLPKEVYQAQTEEERKAMPILGNVAPLEFTEREPASSTETLPENSDLPF